MIPRLLFFTLIWTFFGSSLTSFGYEHDVTSDSRNESRITKKDYCEFLDVFARDDVHHLYDETMGSQVLGATIYRLGEEGHYEYVCEDNELDAPLRFINALSAWRYVHARELQVSSGWKNSEATECGVYSLDDDVLLSINDQATYQLLSPSIPLEVFSPNNLESCCEPTLSILEAASLRAQASMSSKMTSIDDMLRSSYIGAAIITHRGATGDTKSISESTSEASRNNDGVWESAIGIGCLLGILGGGYAYSKYHRVSEQRRHQEHEPLVASDFHPPASYSAIDNRDGNHGLGLSESSSEIELTNINGSSFRQFLEISQNFQRGGNKNRPPGTTQREIGREPSNTTITATEEPSTLSQYVESIQHNTHSFCTNITAVGNRIIDTFRPLYLWTQAFLRRVANKIMILGEQLIDWIAISLKWETTANVRSELERVLQRPDLNKHTKEKWTQVDKLYRSLTQNQNEDIFFSQNDGDLGLDDGQNEDILFYQNNEELGLDNGQNEDIFFSQNNEELRLSDGLARLSLTTLLPLLENTHKIHDHIARLKGVDSSQRGARKETIIDRSFLEKIQLAPAERAHYELKNLEAKITTIGQLMDPPDHSKDVTCLYNQAFDDTKKEVIARLPSDSVSRDPFALPEPPELTRSYLYLSTRKINCTLSQMKALINLDQGTLGALGLTRDRSKNDHFAAAGQAFEQALQKLDLLKKGLKKGLKEQQQAISPLEPFPKLKEIEGNRRQERAQQDPQQDPLGRINNLIKDYNNQVDNALKLYNQCTSKVDRLKQLFHG